MMPLREVFSRADKMLLICGLAGIFVYLLFLPRVHPDGAPAYSLATEEILDRAKGFTFNRGYNLTGYEWDARLDRSVDLIDSLQVNKTEESLYELLKNPQYENLPAYGWEVTARKSRPDGEEARITLKLTQHGETWQFETSNTEQVKPVREALLQTPTNASRPPDFLDSTQTANLTARFWLINARATITRSDSGELIAFRNEDAEALANYYLEKSHLHNFSLKPDSIIRPDELEKSIVRIVYNGEDPANDVPVRAELDVDTAGVLQKMNASFYPSSPEYADDEDGISFDFGADGIVGTLIFLGYFLLGIFTFILFLRRLNARLIDVKGAMQDAIWGGLFAALSMANAAGWNIFRLGEEVNVIGVLTLIGTILAAGSAGAFAVFIVSCATDSIARANWPQRLKTLTLARNVRFINASMGVSLVRSSALAGILLGVTTLTLFLPGLSYPDLDNSIHGHNMFSPFLSLVTSNGLYGMLICMMLLLSIGATLYSRRPNRRLVIITIVIFAALLQIGPLHVKPLLPQLFISGFIGLSLILTLFRFDYFSAFGGYTLYSILWYAIPYWLVLPSDAWLDSTLALALIPATFIFGLIGLVSGREVEDTSQMVPTYLKEMAQQERMRGELEIARQVQSSLLPRRMPTIHGADIAAMCLPAQEVGGDYFDFIPLDKNRTAVVIGDVSGKGIQAGFFMTLTKGFLHAICQHEKSPAKVLTKVNHLFCKNVPRGTFISIIYGILDMENNTFTFARAGHDPILYSSTELDSPAFVQPKGMAIGLTPRKTFEDTIHNEVIDLHPGDLLVFYTDGVTEAVNQKMEQFGVERLLQKVESTGLKKSARQVLQEISEHIQAFCQSAGRADDMTMIILRIAPAQNLISAISSESQSWLEHEL